MIRMTLSEIAQFSIKQEESINSRNDGEKRVLIMAKQDVFFLLVGTFGAFIQELVHWYSLRNNLSCPKYKRLLNSSTYWMITVAMIVSSGLGAWLWYYDQPHSPRDYLLAGAAFPLILKKAVVAWTSGQKEVLGVEEKESAVSIFKDYFGVRSITGVAPEDMAAFQNKTKG